MRYEPNSPASSEFLDPQIIRSTEPPLWEDRAVCQRCEAIAGACGRARLLKWLERESHVSHGLWSW